MLGDDLATQLNSDRARADVASLESDDPCRMWLGGLPPRTTEYAVIQLTRQFGKLSDFRFPVHRAGENQGSTIGYCFVSYVNPDDAQRAILALDGVNFHGSRLIARRAHPTRDELSVVQRSQEEAALLRITEQAKLCEAKLRSRLTDSPDTEEVAETDVDSKKKTALIRLGHDEREDTAPGAQDEQSPSLDSNSSALRCTPVIPDLYGRLGRIDPTRARLASASSSVLGLKQVSRPGPKRPMETKQAIRRIELALRQLEQTPVGGLDMLQPICTNRRPLIPPGVMARPATAAATDSRGSMRGGCHPPRRRFDRRGRSRF